MVCRAREEFQNIRTRQKCYLEDQNHSLQLDVPQKQVHIYSSKFFHVVIDKLCNDKLSVISICSYLIENEVCYLVLCEKNYSKRAVYNYLEDIAQEFHSSYGKHVNTVTRPYSFIEFSMYFSFSFLLRNLICVVLSYNVCFQYNV